MKKILFCLSMLCIISINFCFSQEEPTQKIVIKNDSFYYNNMLIRRTDKIHRIIRAADDDIANRLLDNSSFKMNWSIATAITGGMALGGTFGLAMGAGLGDKNYIPAILVGVLGTGITSVSFILVTQAINDLKAAVQRYNLVINKQQEITLNFNLKHNGFSILISY